MENIKLKQQVNYLESRQEHNMNYSEKMKINSEKQTVNRKRKNEKTSSVKTNGTATEKVQENNKEGY